MAKILIVDDDPETTKLFESIVKTGGHVSQSVLEARDSIVAAQSFQPDVIMLDIMMANVNGITICKHLKADDALKRIPVMMVSALSDEGSKRDSINAGAEMFLTKPVMPKDLLGHIQTVLQTK